jgi:hypothetical protein
LANGVGAGETAGASTAGAKSVFAGAGAGSNARTRVRRDAATHSSKERIQARGFIRETVKIQNTGLGCWDGLEERRRDEEMR